MHINILKLVYIYCEFKYVLANHVTIFRDVKVKGSIH